MKKLTLIPAALMLCAAAYGQGELTFENGSASKIGITGTPVTFPTHATQPTVQVALFYQTDSGGAAPTAINASGTLGSFLFFGVTPLAGPNGFFNGGNIVLNGVAGGANAWIEIIAWNNSAGTLANALTTPNEIVGFSSVFAVATIDPTITPKPTDNLLSSSPAFTGAVMQPIPEPTTIALGGIGAASLLLFRRRK